MAGQVSSLFQGLVFYVYENNKDVEGLLRKHGGKVLAANDLSERTIMVALSEGRRKPRLPEDEFGEDQWKVTSLWVEECIKSGSLVPLLSSEGMYIIGKAPIGASDPILTKLQKEFTPAEDELLKKYAIEAANKGYELDTDVPWENITRQKKHPLSRFNAEELRARYESFAAALTPTTEKKRVGRPPGSKTKRPKVSEEDEPTTSSGTPRLQKLKSHEAAKASKTEGNASEATGSKPTTSGPVQRLLKAAKAIEQESDDEGGADSVRAEGKYTLEEDEKMKTWAAEHPTLSQTEMWKLASENNLCPGRGVKSMKLHFRKLNERMNRTRPVIEGRAKNFSPEEDHLLYRWIHHYRSTQGDRGIWGKTMWEKAEERQVLPGRSAEQMFNRFHNKLSKQLEQGLSRAAEDTSELPWESLPFVNDASPIRQQRGVQKTAVAPSGVITELQFPHHSAHAKASLNRLRERFPDVSLEEILRAMFFTCGSEGAAGRLLAKEEPDSKYDIWTTEEDRALYDGKTLSRPDVYRRKVFLGIEKRLGA